MVVMKTYNWLSFSVLCHLLTCITLIFRVVLFINMHIVHVVDEDGWGEGREGRGGDGRERACCQDLEPDV